VPGPVPESEFGPPSSVEDIGRVRPVQPRPTRAWFGASANHSGTGTGTASLGTGTGRFAQIAG
jgi:hypothetical protein